MCNYKNLYEMYFFDVVKQEWFFQAASSDPVQLFMAYDAIYDGVEAPMIIMYENKIHYAVLD